MKLFGIFLVVFAVVGMREAIPLPPDQLLGWLVPEECPTSTCPAINIPLCGTNHVTYTNECFFKQAKCASNVDLAIANFGSC